MVEPEIASKAVLSLKITKITFILKRKNKTKFYGVFLISKLYSGDSVVVTSDKLGFPLLTDPDP